MIIFDISNQIKSKFDSCLDEKTQKIFHRAINELELLVRNNYVSVKKYKALMECNRKLRIEIIEERKSSSKVKQSLTILNRSLKFRV